MLQQYSEPQMSAVDQVDQAKAVAGQRVLEDLVNALLAEKLLQGHPELELIHYADWKRIVQHDELMSAVDLLLKYEGQDVRFIRWRLSSVDQHMIVFTVYPAIVQPYRFTCTGGLYEVSQQQGISAQINRIDAETFMQYVIQLVERDEAALDKASAERFMTMLEQAIQQLAWSLESLQDQADVLSLPQAESYIALERKAAYRDRPFHPVSKAKLGWSKAEYCRYIAEYSEPIELRWMAVKREYVVREAADVLGHPMNAPSNVQADPMDVLLSDAERQALVSEMKQRGLDQAQFTAIPVHPWQFTAILPTQLHAELEQGICVPLELVTGQFKATSSIRSLMSQREGLSLHLKLPLGVHSLGAVRYLSAIKLMNGGRAERLMRQAQALDPVLGKKLFLCDESQWWAYLPEDRDLFADHPRHFSAMARRYPDVLVKDDQVRLIPMSAFGTYKLGDQRHLFDEWLELLGQDRSDASILQCLKNVLVPYYEICLRLFELGMMPEVHGQNSVLVWKQGRIEGLLLRDHDALRVHVPWLKENGLEDPAYDLRSGVPNSLYHDTPQKLLAYFQMLGIQVNSYAIVQSISQHYRIPEQRLWMELQTCLMEAMRLAELSDHVKQVLETTFFGEADWPWKQLIRPLIKQQSRVPGSMPSGQGKAPNPFKVLAQRLSDRSDCYEPYPSA